MIKDNRNKDTEKSVHHIKYAERNLYKFHSAYFMWCTSLTYTLSAVEGAEGVAADVEDFSIDSSSFI